jgi:hypothetical protein
MNNLIIDVYTKDAHKIVQILHRLKSTGEISFAPYANAPECAQIRIMTTKSVEEMEDWLYNQKAVSDYIGVVEA